MFRPTVLLAMLALLFCTLFVNAQDSVEDPLDTPDSAAGGKAGGFNVYVRQYRKNTRQHLPQGSCTNRNAAHRKEWGSLTKNQRLDYIKALKCIHTKPSKISKSLAPGARNRYDDFQAIHIKYTTVIHATGSFFAWHRWFVYIWEKALRDECGYTGWQPYWDWSKYADLPTTSNPLYDGSATSLSGNGKYLPNRNGTLQPFPIPDPNPPAIYTAPGTGGGYIFSGPLVDWIQNLGPYYNQTVKNGQPVPRNPGPMGLGYNPRKIIRDFNSSLIQASNSYPAVTSLVNDNKDIATFQNAFFQGAHLGGHSFISGVDNDLFTSPGDPLFWFHHAQVDRVWSIWQALDFKKREFAIDGTRTLLNMPPSPNATLADPMPFGGISPDVSIKTAMSPTQGGLCYVYD